MEQPSKSTYGRVADTVTINEIIDDLRASEEVVRRFERRYWVSSADFYELYQQGLLDDGEQSEDFALWAGFSTIKLEREAPLQLLSRERTAKLRATTQTGTISMQSIEPVLQLN